MFRRDLVHVPILDESTGEVHCADCAVRVPADSGMAALSMDGVLIDVAGYGTTMYPDDRDSIGKEAIKCTHPAAEAQRLQVEIVPCDCQIDPDCVMCGGSGVLARMNGEIVAVKADSLSDEQLFANSLEVETAHPLTDMERMAARAAFQNWVAMRDATRPEGVESS